MLSRVYSGAVIGIDAVEVEVEINCGGVDPQVIVVGLPDTAVKESKDRVFTALINSALPLPKGRITINLAPADLRKEGPIYDLPIALAMTAAEKKLDPQRLNSFTILGELALSGEVRRVRGVLPIALMTRAVGRRGLIVPALNAAEAAVVEGLEVYPVNSLREAADFISGTHFIKPVSVDMDGLFAEHGVYNDDFEDVKGQEFAKRAVEVAVAGGHNILCIGPPGTGKSMLARRVPSILPPLTLEEALQVTKIHSIAGILPREQSLVIRRPFRTPHHSISDAGLLGGGSNPSPGEVSLAHYGVLFLDELPEFKRNVLEVMRQPIEEGSVTISRVAASVNYPCRFMLVAAMNPCPCGYYADSQRECRCTPLQIQRYRNRISGPLLDRIDIHVEVPSVRYQDLIKLERGENSDTIRERVVRARRIQQQRYRNIPGIHCNAAMDNRGMQKNCRLDSEAQELIRHAMHQLNFSARAYDRILKVARTIADLGGCETLSPAHISEAVQYRSLDRRLWN